MDCAGCGHCCDPVWLDVTPAEFDELLARLAAGGRSMSAESVANAEWFRDHFTPDPTDPVPPPGGVGSPFRCDAFDPASRLCTAHDERPPVCRRYPYYGDEPSRVKVAFPEGCSYKWDLPPDHPDRGPVVGRLLPLWVADAPSTDATDRTKRAGTADGTTGSSGFTATR